MKQVLFLGMIFLSNESRKRVLMKCRKEKHVSAAYSDAWADDAEQ